MPSFFIMKFGQLFVRQVYIFFTEPKCDRTGSALALVRTDRNQMQINRKWEDIENETISVGLLCLALFF